MADVGDEKVRADLASLVGELPVLVGGDRVLLHHQPATHVVSETRPVGVSVGLAEHRVRGAQKPEASVGGFGGQHAEEATH